MTHDQRLEAATNRLRTESPPDVHKVFSESPTGNNVVGTETRNILVMNGFMPRSLLSMPVGLTEADMYSRYLQQTADDNWCRKAERDAPSQPWHGPQGRWLTVYHVQLAYGGPEEGGWWYDAGERLEYVDVTGRNFHNTAMQLVAKHADLDDPRGLHSVVSTGVITVIGPSRHPGSEHYPDSRPQYE
jgi:hypothetical protein